MKGEGAKAACPRSRLEIKGILFPSLPEAFIYSGQANTDTCDTSKRN
jgi:hypothetical protein